MKDGVILTNEFENSLTLSNIGESNGGVYTCIVSNRAGSEAANSLIHVEPYFTTEPLVSLLTRVNDMVNLTCEANGFPAPSITWVKLDSNLMPVEEVSSNSVLLFHPVLFGDEGNYQCIANSTAPNGTDLTLLYQPSSVLAGKSENK